MVAHRVVCKEVTAQDNESIHQHAQEKGPEAHGRKESQRGTQKCRKKYHIHQVYKSTRKTLRAKLRNAIFTWVMPHLDLCNTESSPVRHNGHKTMELAIEFQVTILDYFTAIRLKTIVDVMQVNARHCAH